MIFTKRKGNMRKLGAIGDMALILFALAVVVLMCLELNNMERRSGERANIIGRSQSVAGT